MLSSHYISKDSKIKIFSGTSNLPLAQEISSFLGIPLSSLQIKKFSDGETFIKIQETVRGYDVFFIQSTSTPVNEYLMELLIAVDAFKRASAKTINVVIPYYGYARQDRKGQGREAISAKLVADLISAAGADRVIAVDLHTGQLQGFFDTKMDHLYAMPVFAEYFQKKNLNDLVVVSPDAGGIHRCQNLAKKLGEVPIGIIDKRRTEHNKAEVYNLIGNVEGKNVIVLDDILDTGNTLIAGAQMLKSKGAKSIYACVTHGVFSGQAFTKLFHSDFDEIIYTNTVNSEKHPISPSLVCLSVAPILGEAIYRIYGDESVSELFN